MKTIGLVLISASILFFFLGHLSLIDPDEGRYAESAREMMNSNQYLIPLLNSAPRINKPILFYWTIVASYKIFGVNEFAARFPSALSGLGLILGLYLFVKEEKKEKRSFIPMLVLLSSPAFLISSRIAITDMLFTTFIIFSIFTFWLGLGNKKFIFLSFIFAGLSLATKGPAGVLLIFLSILLFSIIERDRSYFKRLFNPWGIMIMLLIGGGWYLMLFFKIGQADFFELIREETLGRFQEGFVHREPFYYYIPLIFAGFIPWSFFFFRLRKSDLSTRLNRFLICYVFVAVLFFSLCKSKLPTYILSIFPLLAIVLGDSIERAWEKRTKAGLFFFFTLTAVSLALRFIPPNFIDVGVSLSFYSIALIIFLIAVPLLMLYKKKLKIQFLYLFLSPVLIYFYLLLSYGDAFSNYRSTESLFRERDLNAETIYTWKFFKPSILFYSKSKVKEIEGIEDFKGNYIITPKKELSFLKERLPSFEIISETDKYYLVKVQKLQK
ncbi:MAG: glycosyltransferase family 39 protein [Candidatus Kaelpia imicola]|nr:glycosyltransferase family 39 protein [Candidatus Kaelpia imicola]